MAEQDTSSVLFVDGPIVGEWRDLPVGHYGGYWVDTTAPDGTPTTTCYQPWQVRVSIGSTDHLLRVAYSDFHDDLPALTIRHLLTRKAVKALPGLKEQA